MKKPNPPKRKWFEYIPFMDKSYNDRYTRYQNDIDEYRWNMENAYNSPASQVARYKDAGLSPGLMYGQGDSGNAGSMPEAKRPDSHTGPLNSMAMLSGVMDMALKKSNIKMAQEKANQEHIRTMDMQNDFNNQWIQSYDFKTNTMKDAKGNRIKINYEDMPVKQRQYVENIRKQIAEARTQEHKEKLAEKLVQWYTFSQISSIITGVGPGLLRLL